MTFNDSAKSVSMLWDMVSPARTAPILRAAAWQIWSRVLVNEDVPLVAIQENPLVVYEDIWRPRPRVRHALLVDAGADKILGVASVV